MPKMSGRSKKSKENCVTAKVMLKKGFKPTATAYLQIFGSGAGDTSPSVFLFADSQRYIFSCGEGTQRLFHEHKLKLGKINNVFLSQLNWQSIGGLPGLLLTLREACKHSLNIHGPTGLSDFLKASECFMPMYNLDVKCSQYDGKNDGLYEDENITVKPISIQGEITNNFSHNSKISEVVDSEDSSLDSSNDDTNLHEHKRGHCGVDIEQESLKRLKLDVKARTVVNYICELVAVPGKMNVKKALALGVPSGPLLGKLQKGEDVTLKDGTVVKAEDIMEKSSCGAVFCIIDCPSEYHLKQLQTNQELLLHQENGGRSLPTIIIHLSPAEIVETQDYQAWATRFGEKCQHLFLSSGMCPSKVAAFSQTGIQYCLNQLNSDIFPRLFASHESQIEAQGLRKDNWTAGEPYLIFHLRPTAQIGYDRRDVSSKWDILVEKVGERLRNLRPTKTITDSEIRDALKDFINPKKFVCSSGRGPKQSSDSSENCLSCDLKNMDKDFSVVFLGTGASLPSKYRNVSCTLVNISSDKAILLDCGEGSYGQLFRHYGPNLDNMLRKLCCIFISHIHADHHLGLVRILQAREKSAKSLAAEDRPDSIAVIGPKFLLRWLRYYGSFCDTISLRFYDSRKASANCKSGTGTLSSILESEVCLVPVQHCPRAFGLVLTHKKGWKLVYSGDTRPCTDLIQEGLGATVLIHEATLEDNLYTEAIAKQHSTTSEAIQCGQKMRAKFTLLNHFSQRYPKIPVFSEEFNDCVGIAFDHMEVNFENLNDLPKLLQPLQVIFREEIEEQKIRTESNIQSTEDNSKE